MTAHQSEERREVSEACECGHGRYNHLMRGLLSPPGECIRCNCERYRQVRLSGRTEGDRG